MRRGFFIGTCIGLLVFLQGMLIFRLPIGVHALQLWALGWSGAFGLMLSATFATVAQATWSLISAAIGLVLFYGGGAVVLVAAHRSFKRAGVVCAGVTLLFVHVGLYLAVIRSVVA
jgi:hypothetical protein